MNNEFVSLLVNMTMTANTFSQPVSCSIIYGIYLFVYLTFILEHNSGRYFSSNFPLRKAIEARDCATEK